MLCEGWLSTKMRNAGAQGSFSLMREVCFTYDLRMNCFMILFRRGRSDASESRSQGIAAITAYWLAPGQTLRHSCHVLPGRRLISRDK